ncbi:hypothetical protein [Azoarcus sp. KH32C]|uniref:hypothetical protein n=1 Tax=Azoarcus sp. KH32C TaxID=748247 RepID=UPI0002386D3C|nr:hypothetical protein [Azoarcus sp. KH32C]BAL22803.1 hypothetical protein AZKH_0457 [Azoarcus sp. KH32C]
MSLANRTLAAALISAACAFGAGPAQATHYTVACAPELNAVEAAIMAGTFLGRSAATDQSNLLAKLDAAAAKIQLQKFPDAIDKLEDISNAATALAGAPKPKLNDASLINSSVRTAITCVGNL